MGAVCGREAMGYWYASLLPVLSESRWKVPGLMAILDAPQFARITRKSSIHPNPFGVWVRKQARHLLIFLFHRLSVRMEMLGAVSPSIHMCAARPGLIK